MAHPRRARSILHLITGIRPGGAERQLLEFLQSIDRNRYRPTLAYLKGPPILRPEFEAAGVPVRRVAGPGPLAVLRLLRLIREGKFELLHTHLVQADLVGAAAAALGGVPLVSSRHNDDAFLRNRGVAMMYRIASRPASRVIAISDWVGRFIIDKRTVDDPRKVIRIHYGLDPASFDARANSAEDLRAELDIAPDAVIIGCVARLVEQKGHRYLLDAMPDLISSQPRAVLLVVGEGELRTELESRAAALGLIPAVRFAGFRRDNARVMQAIDILALPSLWEGFGLVLLEAMAMRKPVVASRVSAIPEIVEDGATGYLVEPRDSAGLTSALARLLGSADLRQRLGEAGRRRLEESFSVHRMALTIQAIYDEVTSN